MAFSINLIALIHLLRMGFPKKKKIPEVVQALLLQIEVPKQFWLMSSLPLVFKLTFLSNFEPLITMSSIYKRWGEEDDMWVGAVTHCVSYPNLPAATPALVQPLVIHVFSR